MVIGGCSQNLCEHKSKRAPRRTWKTRIKKKMLEKKELQKPSQIKVEKVGCLHFT